MLGYLNRSVITVRVLRVRGESLRKRLSRTEIKEESTLLSLRRDRSHSLGMRNRFSPLSPKMQS